jgi:hypothetical protein
MGAIRFALELPQILNNAFRMAALDAENKEAAALVDRYKQILVKAKQYSQTSTATVRAYIDKVAKNEAKLLLVIKATEDQLRAAYNGRAEHVRVLEKTLKKAEAVTEEIAAQAMTKKIFNSSLIKGAYNKSAPAKPQLIKAFEEMIEDQAKEAKRIFHDLKTKQEAKWNSSVQKHFAACEAAKALGSVEMID